MHDIITHDNSGENLARAFCMARGRILGFSIDLPRRHYNICTAMRIILFLLPGETPGGSKITKENYETCLEVNPTLAGRHQRNHHAAKPNWNVTPQRQSVGIKTKMLEHPRSSPPIAYPTRSRTEEHPCWLGRGTPPQSGQIHPVMTIQHTWPSC